MRLSTAALLARTLWLRAVEQVDSGHPAGAEERESTSGPLGSSRVLAQLLLTASCWRL